MLDLEESELKAGRAIDIYSEKLSTYKNTLKEQIGVNSIFNAGLGAIQSNLLEFANTYGKVWQKIQDQEPPKKKKTGNDVENDILKIEISGGAIEELDVLEEAFKRYSDAILEKDSQTMSMMKMEREGFVEAGINAFRSLEDSFVELAMTGQTSFKDMAKSIIADIMRIYIRTLMLRAVSAATGVPIPFHTGTTEVKHTGGTIGGTLPSYHTGTSEVKRTGGTIGGTLPSYHKGMRSDERIAKLQVGEAVINRAGAKQNPDAIDAINSRYKIGDESHVTNNEYKIVDESHVTNNDYRISSEAAIDQPEAIDAINADYRISSEAAIDQPEAIDAINADYRISSEAAIDQPEAIDAINADYRISREAAIDQPEARQNLEAIDAINADYRISGEAFIDQSEAIDAINADYKIGGKANLASTEYKAGGESNITNAEYKAGGESNITNAEIKFEVTAMDASSFNDYLVNNKSTIENIINRSLQTNGSVRKTIKQVM